MRFNNRLVTFLFALLLAGPARALTFTVTNTADDSNAHDANPGDGICADALASCTLRAALEEANATGVLDVIQFADNLSGSVLMVSASEGALPPITNQVFILGETIDGYSLAATLLRDAPPQLTLDGSNLSFANENGLLFSGVGGADSIVSALSIVNFPGSGILAAPGADRIVVHRNYIGVKPDRSAGANQGHGFYASGSHQHLIGKDRNGGGTAFTELGNVFANNGKSGIRLESSNSNELRSNLIGISPSGTGDRGNGQYGIHLSGNSNVIGDRLVSLKAGNFIAGNNLGGLLISGDDNLVHANQFGKGETGSFINSEGYGIGVFGDDNFIGNFNDNGNLIYEHEDEAIRLGTEGGTSASRNFVIGNKVGSPGTQFPLLLSGNGRGIILYNGNTNQILDNVVINSTDGAIEIAGNYNTLLRNQVGYVKTLFGVDAERNISAVTVTGSNNTIGTIDNGNIIAGNALTGLAVSGNDNSIVHNHIGMTEDYIPLGNSQYGIFCSGTRNSILSNVIGNNSNNGIGVDNFTEVTIRFNYIGITPNGEPAGNDRHGIRVFDFNQGADISNNDIAFNTNDGISLDGPEGGPHRILINYVHGNGEYGIDLGADGETFNDIGDADLGVNRLQNSPTFRNIEFTTGLGLAFQYTIDSFSPNSAYPFQVEFYWTDNKDNGPARYFLGTDYFTTQSAQRNLEFNSLKDETHGWLTGTATDNDGNTSEFAYPLFFGRLPNETMYEDSFED